MKVWVGCLAAYNCGCLHGDWFDLVDFDSMEELTEAIDKRVLKTSPEPMAEEWAVFDGDEVPGSLMRGHYPDLSAIFAYAKQAERAAEDANEEAFELWVDNQATGEEPDYDEFLSEYRGQFRDLAEYAEEWASETGMFEGVPENIQSYFDFERFGRDLELGGDVFTLDSAWGVHVFSGCC